MRSRADAPKHNGTRCRYNADAKKRAIRKQPAKRCDTTATRMRDATDSFRQYNAQLRDELMTTSIHAVEHTVCTQYENGNELMTSGHESD